MRYGVPLVVVAAALGQQAPIGILRGDLVTWKAAGLAGQLNVKTIEGHVYQCTYDAKTYFERDNQRVAPGAMSEGDRLEIVSDRRPGSDTCYARTVHVMDPVTQPLSALARARFRSGMSPTESFAPRGDLTFAGVVVRINPDLLVLRTRSEGEKVIVLRHDTRYIGDGQRVDPGGLKRNTRVFIRAGRNLDNEIEAYQIVWGQIIQPN
jgi:hypothetical protein